MRAGFRPHTTRSFCFGKRTQNHGRPGEALAFLVIPGLIGDPGLLSLRTEEKEMTLDPRLLMSRMTEGEGNFGTGAQPRPQVPSRGAMGWRATNA